MEKRYYKRPVKKKQTAIFRSIWVVQFAAQCNSNGTNRQIVEIYGIGLEYFTHCLILPIENSIIANRHLKKDFELSKPARYGEEFILSFCNKHNLTALNACWQFSFVFTRNNHSVIREFFLQEH